jgi:hypothetical protein
MHVHDAIIQFLDAQEVETVFTLMDEDIMGLTSTIEVEWAEDIEVVEARHEHARSRRPTPTRELPTTLALPQSAEGRRLSRPARPSVPLARTDRTYCSSFPRRH